MRKLVLFSWLVCCFVVLASSVSCEALPPAWKASFEHHLRRIIYKNPKYVWGGINDEKGLDCSGYIWLAAKRAGIPGITRTTSLNMARGLGGWTGIDVEWLHRDAEELDLVFWTWADKPERPHGHVGVLLVGPHSQLIEVTHASKQYGVILTPVQGILATSISRVRRLTIGDRK